jgi:hypothetical protein
MSANMGTLWHGSSGTTPENTSSRDITEFIALERGRPRHYPLRLAVTWAYTAKLRYAPVRLYRSKPQSDSRDIKASFTFSDMAIRSHS